MKIRNIRKTVLIALFFACAFSLSSEKAFSQAGDLIWGPAGTQCTTNTVTGAAGLGVQPLCTGGAGGNATALNGVDAQVTLSVLPTPGTNPVAVPTITNAACLTGTSLMQNCPGVMPPVAGLGNNFQYMSMNAASGNCTVIQSTRIDFDPPVTNPSFTLGDIDNGSAAATPANWQDLVVVTALDDSAANVSASSVVLGGANVTQVTAGASFPATACSTGTLTCPVNTTCFRGLGPTNSNNADSNATLTYTGNIETIIVSYTAGQVNGANNPNDQFIAIGPITWSDTLPVTLSSFSSGNTGGGAVVDWSTSTETSNMGFNIYAHIDGEKVILNDLMIESKAPNSVVPQYYEEQVQLPEGVTKLSIASVDIQGTEEYHGPYEIGQSYGEEPVINKRDWKSAKEQYNQKLSKEGYVMKGGKMRAPAEEEQSGVVSSFIARVSGSSSGSAVCNVAVSGEGLYRLRGRDLRRAGCDFRGESVDDVAVTYKGEPVSRRIRSNTGKIKNGTNILFYTQTPKGKDFIHTTENIYQVQVDSSLVNKHEDIKRPKNRELNGFDTSYMHTVHVEKNLSYDFTNPWGENGEYQEIDPWYEDFTIVRGGGSASKTYSIPVHGDVDTGSAAKLKIRLLAAIDHTELETDHEVELKLNGGTASTHTASGALNWYIETEVAGSDLIGGVNQLELKVNSNPAVFGDFIATDSYGLMYTRPALAVEDVLTFEEPEGSEAAGYSVSGYSVKNVQVYAQKDDQLYKLGTKKKNNGGNYTISFKSLGEGTKYWVSPVSGFNQEGVVTKADEGDIKSGSAEVLIITHPALMGSELDAYESYVSGEGYTTKVVNVQNVYDGFGYGMPTPEGIRSYLEYAKDNLGVKYVVIVGGTTNEYPDPATLESVQYVPTDFEETQDFIYFTPCDGCMADFNGDFVPELKIFRIPSVEPGDTGIIANKSSSYSPAPSVLLLAEENDGNNYSGQLEGITNVLGGYDKMSVYLDDIPDINEAQQAMIEQINDGKRLIMFNGHGGSTTWTFDPLMNVQIAGELNNPVPNVVIPMACYTTYYHHPGVTSLAEQLLFNPGGGPVVISGAGALSSLSDNGTFTESILDKMCDGVTTLAEAVYETKKENPTLTDQVINWDLIGNGFVTIAECEEPVVEPPSGEETTEDQ